MRIQHHTEKAAENEVTAKLGLGGIITAKPSIDINGTDFIGLLRIEDYAKICRIQVKGRSLRSKTSNIKIPEGYVSSAFFVFLYLQTSMSVSETNPIFVFFEEDIRKWRINKKKEYVLNIHKPTYSQSLSPYLFNDDKVKKIKQIIEHSDSSKEIEYLVLKSFFSKASHTCSPSNVSHTYSSEDGILYKTDIATGVKSVISFGFDPTKYEIDPTTDTYRSKIT